MREGSSSCSIQTTRSEVCDTGTAVNNDAYDIFSCTTSFSNTVGRQPEAFACAAIASGSAVTDRYISSKISVYGDNNPLREMFGTKKQVLTLTIRGLWPACTCARPVS